MSSQVAEAAAAHGRAPEEVRVVGVSKYVDLEATRQLAAAGCHDLGESRPQQLFDKASAWGDSPPRVRWHLIGPLQRNKARRTLQVGALIHSIDSLRLLQAVERIAAELERSCDVLLEVNIAEDAAKQGLAAGAVASVLEAAAPLKRVRILGLMAMASQEGGRAAARRQFAGLRELRDQLAANGAGELRELSMGMSGDFEEAIAEGATMIRIGSALFA